MDEFLFVYGTLRSEFENPYARMLRAEGELLGQASVRGSLFSLGHYPGFRHEPEGEVTGELYRLKDPRVTLAALDSYEGDEYDRMAIPVNAFGSAWAYVYKLQPPAGARMESGDFCKP